VMNEGKKSGAAWGGRRRPDMRGHDVSDTQGRKRGACVFELLGQRPYLLGSAQDAKRGGEKRRAARVGGKRAASEGWAES
jgi:hypothetical protein